MAIVYDASWTLLGRRRTVESAMERLAAMLHRALLSIRTIRNDLNARRLYANAFNDASLTNVGRVTQVIERMHKRVTMPNETLTMSYVPDLATFQKLGIGPLPAGVNLMYIEAFVVKLNVAPHTPLSCYICPAFFKGDVYIPKDLNERSGTGTVLHELSHGVGGTVDHAYTWQPEYSRLSDDQRANNADSYRHYCQQFDLLRR